MTFVATSELDARLGKVVVYSQSPKESTIKDEQITFVYGKPRHGCDLDTANLIPTFERLMLNEYMGWMNTIYRMEQTIA